MSFGTAPQALVELFETEWQESRTGREDVPQIIKHRTGGDNPDLKDGVYPLRDRQKVGTEHQRHDYIHCYHTDAGPVSVSDQGYKEQEVIETVQVDIDLTDRTDSVTGERLSAVDRMVGERGGMALGEPPYPGIFGEVKYILETVRRGYKEWDTVSHKIVNSFLGNSNATVSLNVELERVAMNTVE